MKVTVIGAGFSGLITAYFLRKHGLNVEVVDKQSRVGGLIQSIHCDYGIIETAANGMIYTPLLEYLLNDLKLECLPTKEGAKKRFIYWGTPRRWPLGWFETMTFMLRFVWVLVTTFGRSFRAREMETMSQWGQRNFGKAFVKKVLAPGLQGIYAGDVNRLSASLIVGWFFRKQKSNHKNLKYKGTVSFKNGMGELISALKAWLLQNGVEIKLGHEVVYDPRIKNWKWVIATGASSSRQILRNHPIGEQLSMIEVSPILSVTAFFHPLDARTHGFGVLFPRGQGVRALGVLFNNEIFSHRSDYRSETWIYGGALDHEVVDLSETEIVSTLMKDRKILERGLGRHIELRIQKWAEAIPHYTVQLERILSQLKAPPNTYLVGNYLGGLGLSKILERASEIAEEISHQKCENLKQELALEGPSAH